MDNNILVVAAHANTLIVAVFSYQYHCDIFCVSGLSDTTRIK